MKQQAFVFGRDSVARERASRLRLQLASGWVILADAIGSEGTGFSFEIATQLRLVAHAVDRSSEGTGFSFEIAT